MMDHKTHLNNHELNICITACQLDCIEIKKIEEFLEKELTVNRTPKYQRLVILSDSKGNYLRTECNKLKDKHLEIIWWTLGGRNTHTGLKFLTENINKIQDGVQTMVLFWHFTCDITRKENSFIYPRHRSSQELIEKITPYLNTLKEIHQAETSIDIGILEAPPIFTREWNRQKELANWEIIDDSELHDQIVELNQRIRETNVELGYKSPRFECDFQHRRRNKRKRPGLTKTREFWNPILLKDGVHPVGIVALKWLVKIICSISEEK